VSYPCLYFTVFILQLWQINAAEQMMVDDMAINPDKYKDKKVSDLIDEEDFDEQNVVQYSKVKYKNTLIPQMTMVSIILVNLHLYMVVDLFTYFDFNTLAENKSQRARFRGCTCRA